MAHSQFALLRSRRFLPLFATQFLGALNDNLLKSALVMLITYEVAGATGANAEILVAAAGGVFILPFFLFSATAGQLADRCDKAWLIRWVKLAEIAIMAGAAGGFLLGSIPPSCCSSWARTPPSSGRSSTASCPTTCRRATCWGRMPSSNRGPSWGS